MNSVFRRLTREDLEDIIAILRMICGGSVIAILFQDKWHGILIAGIMYLAVQWTRHLSKEQQE